MDNPEKLSTLCTQDNKRQRKPKMQSRMDNPEKLETLCTHMTQDEDKQNKKTQHRKLKR